MNLSWPPRVRGCGAARGGWGRSRRNDKEEGVEGLEGMRKKKEARHLWCRTAAL